MNDKFGAYRAATAEALLRAPGSTPAELRQAIADGRPPEQLRALVQKIFSRAYTVTDSDFEALKNIYSEEQLFEIVASAAFGAALARLRAARQAMEAP